MTKPVRRHARAKAPIPMEEPAMRKARRLPMPGPGIVINIPLRLLPAYFELYGLEPVEGQPRPPTWKPVVLLVRRTASLVKRTRKQQEEIQ